MSDPDCWPCLGLAGAGGPETIAHTCTPPYTLERRFHLGGTDFATRLGAAIVTHPDITEVLENTVTGTGKEGGYAADLRIVYRAERELDWGDLRTVTQYVPLYAPCTSLIRWLVGQRTSTMKGPTDEEG